ncbi:DUF4124 domain-containing protein [Aquincola sp. J276]|uniref:DUF4124 domain-containing protein n=1 Tax=Aquincola sp. J276 TaxID=2898432 RepID=UPI002150D717|nr:DUF4124 domain-containing protein [Aquincola sp. J276]MCR5864626.1 DUF4124 domain-containing protein [Aquincola sp. J276]
MHRPSMFVTTGVLCAAAVLMSSAARAQWVWKDSRGQVHASDLPPPRDIPDRNVIQRPAAAPTPRPAATGATTAPAAPASPAASVPAARVDPELEARKRRADEEQAAQKKAEETRQASQRVENCNRAREALRQLESGLRIARVNEKGEREFLDDQQLGAETQRARQVAASECR